MLNHVLVLWFITIITKLFCKALKTIIRNYTSTIITMTAFEVVNTYIAMIDYAKT